MARRRLKVFISYARSDQAKAHDLYKRLTNDGLDAWIDKESLLPGQDWELEIRKFIRRADVVIVCLSKKFNKDGFRQKEVRLALEAALEKPEGEIFIIPVRLEKCDNLESLRNLHQADLFDSPPYASAEDGYQNLLYSLLIRARKVGASVQVTGRRMSIVPLFHQRDYEFVPDNVVKTWLIRHGLIANPFSITDINNYLFYPDGATRPDQWEFLLEPIPLVALCPTMEDAHVLSRLLEKECLPVKMGRSATIIKQQIFPTVVWVPKINSTKPLATLAHSVVRTWLDFILTNPHTLLDLDLTEQNALIELLCWSLGSKSDLIRVMQIAVGSKTGRTSNLFHNVVNLDCEHLLQHEPQDNVLLAWLKIRPFGMQQTNLIFSEDVLSERMLKWWFEQLDSLVPTLLGNGIITKFFISSHFPVKPSLSKIRLNWSNNRLRTSLNSQFESAMDKDIQKEMGQIVDFRSLFGSDPTIGYFATEEGTTDKLIAESKNSLARMLTLGNRLFEHHCKNRIKDGVPEKYLYVEDLETILKTA